MTISKTFISTIVLATLPGLAYAGGPADLWGKKEDTKRLEEKRDQAHSALAGRMQALNEQKKRNDEIRAKMNALKKKLQDMKAQSLALVIKDNKQFQVLIDQQNLQLSETLKLQMQAIDLNKRLTTAALESAGLTGQRQALRVMQPLMANSSANRELWDRALIEMNQDPRLNTKDREAIAKLRAQLKEADAWFWNKPPLLLNEFTQILEAFSDPATLTMTTSLIKASAQLMMELNMQMTIQTQLTDALQTMKSDHDKMTASLSGGSV